MFDIDLGTSVSGFDVQLSPDASSSSRVNVKISSVFGSKPTYVKISNVFVEKPSKVKVGGSFV